jgi:hypothetical protein
MLVAGFAPPLPANLPMALGLALRMAPLALFMLLNAAIVAGIAARSERDLTGRGVRALMLALLAGALSSGCALSSEQRVLVAAPTRQAQLSFDGAVATFYAFDLEAVPEWRDHRTSLHDVTDVSLMGEFIGDPGGPTSAGAPADVQVWFIETVLYPLTPDPGTPTQVWSPLHLEPSETHRVDWDEGAKRFNGDKERLRREIMGDGSFTIMVVSQEPPGSPGAASVENLRLGATLQVR